MKESWSPRSLCIVSLFRTFLKHPTKDMMEGSLPAKFPFLLPLSTAPQLDMKGSPSLSTLYQCNLNGAAGNHWSWAEPEAKARAMRGPHPFLITERGPEMVTPSTVLMNAGLGLLLEPLRKGGIYLFVCPPCLLALIRSWHTTDSGIQCMASCGKHA